MREEIIEQIKKNILSVKLAEEELEDCPEAHEESYKAQLASEKEALYEVMQPASNEEIREAQVRAGKNYHDDEGV